LKNIPTTADALPAFKEESVIKLFERTGVLSPEELASRFEVYSEQYVLSIEVEAKTVVDMATTKIYPAAISYLSTLTTTAESLSSMGLVVDGLSIKSVANEANQMMALVNELDNAIEKHDFSSIEEHMNFCAHTICTLMLGVRTHADALECLIADELWPLPKYQEMLFIK
jgi:glutamine synthetase